MQQISNYFSSKGIQNPGQAPFPSVKELYSFSDIVGFALYLSLSDCLVDPQFIPSKCEFNRLPFAYAMYKQTNNQKQKNTKGQKDPEEITLRDTRALQLFQFSDLLKLKKEQGGLAYPIMALRLLNFSIKASIEFIPRIFDMLTQKVCTVLYEKTASLDRRCVKKMEDKAPVVERVLSAVAFVLMGAAFVVSAAVALPFKVASIGVRLLTSPGEIWRGADRINPVVGGAARALSCLGLAAVAATGIGTIFAVPAFTAFAAPIVAPLLSSSAGPVASMLTSAASAVFGVTSSLSLGVKKIYNALVLKNKASNKVDVALGQDEDGKGQGRESNDVDITPAQAEKETALKFLVQQLNADNPFEKDNSSNPLCQKDDPCDVDEMSAAEVLALLAPPVSDKTDGHSPTNDRASISGNQYALFGALKPSDVPSDSFSQQSLSVASGA